MGTDERQHALVSTLDQALGLAAERLGAAIRDLEVERLEHVVWNDACLGCPVHDEGCPEVLTPGLMLVAGIAGKRVEVHTDLSGRAKICPLITVMVTRDAVDREPAVQVSADTATVAVEDANALRQILSDNWFFELEGDAVDQTVPEQRRYRLTVREEEWKQRTVVVDDVGVVGSRLQALLSWIVEMGSEQRPPDALFGYWRHAYEDDAGDARIYRRGDGSWPVARWRDGFTLAPNGHFVSDVPHPADAGIVKRHGRWSHRELRASTGESLRILSVTDTELKLATQ